MNLGNQEKTGYATAITGGIGLGLLPGSEYAGTFVTLLGAALSLIAIVTIIMLFSRELKNEYTDGWYETPFRIFISYLCRITT